MVYSIIVKYVKMLRISFGGRKTLNVTRKIDAVITENVER